MRKPALALAAALTALTALALSPAAWADDTPAAAVSTGDVSSTRAAMENGMNKARTKDFKGAAAEFQAIVDGPGFARLTADIRYGILIELVMAETNAGDAKAAQAHLDQAGAIAPGQRDLTYWEYALSLGYRLGTPDAVADAVTALARDFPDHLNDGDDRYFLAAVSMAGQRGGAHYRAALEALQTAGYHPADPFHDVEYLKMDLVELYVEDGQPLAAKALAESLTQPNSILALQVDKRFAGFVTPDPARLVQARADAVTAAQALAAAHPTLIKGRINLAIALLDDDRPDDALKVLDAALADVAAAKPDSPAYSDVDTYLNWVRDTRKTTLKTLGRWDEAVTAQIQARDTAKTDRVSQRINLADLYIELSRPGDALAEVKTVDATNSSPYGAMAAEGARACAYAEQRDAAKLKASLDILKTHASAGYGPLMDGLRCAGDVDTLAAMYLQRLNDPGQRTTALMELQTWQPYPHMTDWDRKVEQVNSNIAARPDVRAAVEKYGVINTYPITR